MDWNTFISNEFGMPVGWRNMDNESQFFYQPNLLCGVEPNDDMRDNNDENVGGEDIDMQTQPSYGKGLTMEKLLHIRSPLMTKGLQSTHTSFQRNTISTS